MTRTIEVVGAGLPHYVSGPPAEEPRAGLETSAAQRAMQTCAKEGKKLRSPKQPFWGRCRQS